MRETKFRVWDKVENKMFSQKNVIIYFDEIGESIITNDTHRELCDYKLMQYTGLKDINGVEIYEGDIVKIVFNDFTESEDFIGIIKYYEGMFSVDNGNESYKLFDELNMNEVIGNIYENTNLLD